MKSDRSIPSAFDPAKSSNPHKKGSLLYDLHETKSDIAKAKRGIPGEVSLKDMKDTKRRIKKEILDANREMAGEDLKQRLLNSTVDRSIDKMKRFQPSRKPKPREL